MFACHNVSIPPPVAYAHWTDNNSSIASYDCEVFLTSLVFSLIPLAHKRKHYGSGRKYNGNEKEQRANCCIKAAFLALLLLFVGFFN